MKIYIADQKNTSYSWPGQRMSWQNR